MTDRELMRQALELIEPIAHNSTDDPRGKAYEAITALRQALETEREWVGLTDEDILRVKGQFKGTLDVQFNKFAYVIEAKLKEKNHG